jgi:hypothetical protein
VQQVPSAEQVPPLEPRLDLRDAADAIGHIQPAGGLISIIVT